VEVVATAITHLMAGDGMLRGQLVRLADVIIAIVLPMILVGLLAWRRSAIGLIATLIVVVVAAAANVFAFSRGIWLSAALPIFAAAPPAILFTGAAMVGQAARSVFRHTKRAARTISGAGYSGVADPGPRFPQGAGAAGCGGGFH
jgi:adenylate cyclase